MTAREIFNRINQTDELDYIEVKAGRNVSRSAMETVCAFSNEPGIETGYILLGVVPDESGTYSQYIVDPVLELDKIQSDFASQCGSVFNIPVRPEIKVDSINGENVIIVKISELSKSQKPLFFKHEGLPYGAYRRIGPTDHRCTEDDMHVFYSDRKMYDQSVLDGTGLRI